MVNPALLVLYYGQEYVERGLSVHKTCYWKHESKISSWSASNCRPRSICGLCSKH